jgi:hypothetical protein
LLVGLTPRISNFDLENNLFSSFKLKRSFIEKEEWHTITIGNKYLMLSRGKEYIGNSRWRWEVSYFFGIKAD